MTHLTPPLPLLLTGLLDPPFPVSFQFPWSDSSLLQGLRERPLFGCLGALSSFSPSLRCAALWIYWLLADAMLSLFI